MFCIFQALDLIKEALASNPDTLQEILQKVFDFPLKSAEDTMADNKRFLLCEFNRHLESYRSPFSNSYIPPHAGEEPRISDSLLTFEKHANEVWDTYTDLYYGKGAIGSVYVKPLAGVSFLACFLVQNNVQGDERLNSGQWNSGHIVQIGKISKGTAKYKIRSSISIAMEPSNDTCLSGQLCRDIEKTHEVNEQNSLANHLENVGKMIESIEIDLRSSLESVHIPKTQQVLENIRQPVPDAKAGIPILHARLPSQQPKSGGSKKKSFLPPGAVAMPGMGGAHMEALNTAVLKRAGKK